MLGDPVKAVADRALGPLLRLLLRWGLHPAPCRMAEVLVAGLSGAALARGLVAIGAALLALHVLFDWLDGALQRAGAGVASHRRAAWSHALADKVADAAILTGLAAGGLAPLWLCASALLASVLATASGGLALYLGGVPREAALFDRTDRNLLLLLALPAGLAPMGVGAGASLSLAVVLQRAFLARPERERRAPEDPPPEVPRSTIRE